MSCNGQGCATSSNASPPPPLAPPPPPSEGDECQPEVHDETPLPLKQCAALCVVLMNESICATMLFPFVGLLVAHLENENPDDAGYLSGILVGVFQLGQVVSGKMWGRASDVYGRRPALMCGVLFSGIVMLMFGFSSNFWMCVVLRFFHGLFNGNVLVAKTVIADITDKTNEARGFTLVSLTWGVGSLIGPSIGGFLYDPTSSRYLSFLGLDSNGVFGRHPALLPSIVIFLYSELALLVAFLFVRESNPKAQPLSGAWVYVTTAVKQTVFFPLMRLLRRKFGPGFLVNVIVPEATIAPYTSTNEAAKQTALDEREALTGGDLNGTSARDTSVVEAGEDPTADVREQPVISATTNFGYKEAFSHETTRLPLLLYILISGADIAFWETFPLFGIASRASGGLEFASSEIGLLTIINSVPCVVANLMLPQARVLFGDDMKMWRFAATIFAVMVILVPMCSYVSHPMFPLILNSIVRSTGSSWCFSMNFLLIARCAPPGQVGVMNGIGQSCGSAIRSLIPPLIAPIFAWSIARDRWIRFFPFDHYLVFLLASAFLFVSIPLSYHLMVESRRHPHHMIPTDDGEMIDVEDEETVVVLTPKHRMNDAELYAANHAPLTQDELDRLEALSL